MTANERAREQRKQRQRPYLAVGDIVAPLDSHYPKGKVIEMLPLKMVAVEWPDDLLTIHHASTLRRIV